MDPFLELRSVFWRELERMIPGRAFWSYALGALALVFFALQIVTGVFLMAYYRPTAGEAFESIAAIADEVRFGWMMRSLHVWGARFVVVLAIVHLVHVALVRAYRSSRAWVWTLGVVLLFVLVAFDVSGMLLPFDQAAYWSTRFFPAMLSSVPGLGHLFVALLGEDERGIGDAVLRFYALHVGVLPWVAVVLLLFHILVSWRLADRTEAGPGSIPFVPDFLLGVLIAALVGFGLLLSVSVALPPTLLPPADLLSPSPGVRPAWYLLPFHGLVTMASGGAATLFAMACALFLFAIPVLDPARSRERPIVLWLLGGLLLAVATFSAIRGIWGPAG